MSKLSLCGVCFAVCFMLSAAVAQDWHYNGPMDVNIHSPGRVNDGSGDYFSIHELEAPHTVQGYVPPRAEYHRGGRPHSSRPPHYEPRPHYGAPPPPPPPPYYGGYPSVVSHDGNLALPAPPSPHMSRDEYDRWLQHTVPNLNDMPLGTRLRLEWEATGGWDNHRNMRR